MIQRWKTDPVLRDCPREQNGHQKKKLMNYDKVYKEEFLECDPLRDWESIDRCIWLWNWCRSIIKKFDPYNPFTWRILDIGSKDGQFPQWLRDNGYEQAMGIEISKNYVAYARNKGRPIEYGDVCNMDDSWNDNFDFVFAHHVLGLTPDYLKALQEMYRVTNKYMVALNQVPGNPQKHYSYIGSPDIFHQFVEDNPCEVIHNDYLDTGFKNEWVIFVRKNA